MTFIDIVLELFLLSMGVSLVCIFALLLLMVLLKVETPEYLLHVVYIILFAAVALVVLVGILIFGTVFYLFPSSMC